MQKTSEAEGDVAMATVTSTEVEATKPQPVMSARASAFTIASLVGDHDDAGRCTVSTSSSTPDSVCGSTSGTCRGRRQHRNIESPSAVSSQNCSGCTSVGKYETVSGKP